MSANSLPSSVRLGSGLMVYDPKIGWNWQPISTAPKNGTPILVYVPGDYFVAEHFEVAHWTNWGPGVWENQSGLKFDMAGPTHWMPLPDPPAAEAPLFYEISSSGIRIYSGGQGDLNVDSTVSQPSQPTKESSL